MSVTSAKADEDYRHTLRVTAKDLYSSATVTTENDALVTAGDFFKTERTEFPRHTQSLSRLMW